MKRNMNSFRSHKGHDILVLLTQLVLQLMLQFVDFIVICRC